MGERSEKSANLVSGDMEGTTNLVDDSIVAGMQGGGDIRCLLSTTIRIESFLSHPPLPPARTENWSKCIQHNSQQ